MDPVDPVEPSRNMKIDDEVMIEESPKKIIGVKRGISSHYMSKDQLPGLTQNNLFEEKNLVDIKAYLTKKKANLKPYLKQVKLNGNSKGF